MKRIRPMSKPKRRVSRLPVFASSAPKEPRPPWYESLPEGPLRGFFEALESLADYLMESGVF